MALSLLYEERGEARTSIADGLPECALHVASSAQHRRADSSDDPLGRGVLERVYGEPANRTRRAIGPDRGGEFVDGLRAVSNAGRPGRSGRSDRGGLSMDAAS